MATHRNDQQPPPGLGWRRSPWLVLVAATAAITVVACTAPLSDVDLYWHVLMGRDILAHGRLTGDPAWTFAPADPHWQTTQWGSEVLMYVLHQMWDWAGLTLLRLGAALAALAVLAHRLLYRQPASGARAAAFALAGLAVTADIGERPAALSFVLLAVVGGWADRVLATGQWPRYWAPIVLTAVWANLHGYWVLLPAVFGLLTVTQALRRPPLRQLRTPLLLTLATTAAGALTPIGLRGFTAPLSVSAAASPFIEEWGRTGLDAASPALLLLLLAVLAVGCARRATPLPLPHLLYVAACAGFAALAYRNVTPAILLLTPFIARTAAAAFPPRPRAGLALATWVALLALLGGVILGGYRLTAEPRLPAWTPTAAYVALHDGQPHRLLVSYNASGQALALGGPGVQVALDGRADRYGATYLHRYLGLISLAPGWERTLTDLHPTDALISPDAPLRQALGRAGWITTVTTTHYVLLRAP